METKTCLVLCGAGFATSTVGAKACEDACKELGFKCITKKMTAMQGKSAAAQIKPDMILVMSKVTIDFGDTPVVNGVPLITGKGKEEVIQQIKEALLKK